MEGDRELSLRDPLVEDYLDRLERAAWDLPFARRRRLVDDIEAHLNERLGLLPTEAEVRSVLDRLGPPEAIVAAELPRPPAPERAPSGALETAAIILLLFGGFFAGIGWFVGVILLWMSPVWNVRDKLIGTFLWPFGLVTSVWWWASWGLSASTGSPGTIATILDALRLLAILGVPILTAVHLSRRRNA